MLRGNMEHTHASQANINNAHTCLAASPPPLRIPPSTPPPPPPPPPHTSPVKVLCALKEYGVAGPVAGELALQLEVLAAEAGLHGGGGGGKGTAQGLGFLRARNPTHGRAGVCASCLYGGKRKTGCCLSDCSTASRAKSPGAGAGRGRVAGHSGKAPAPDVKKGCVMWVVESVYWGLCGSRQRSLAAQHAAWPLQRRGQPVPPAFPLCHGQGPLAIQTRACTRPRARPPARSCPSVPSPPPAPAPAPSAHPPTEMMLRWRWSRLGAWSCTPGCPSRWCPHP